MGSEGRYKAGSEEDRLDDERVRRQRRQWAEQPGDG